VISTLYILNQTHRAACTTLITLYSKELTVSDGPVCVTRSVQKLTSAWNCLFSRVCTGRSFL